VAPQPRRYYCENHLLHYLTTNTCRRAGYGPRFFQKARAAGHQDLRYTSGAATHAGHLSPVASNPAPVYQRLADALKQLEITPESE